MKRTERHHLKENEFAEWLLGVRTWYEANRQAVTFIGIALVVLAAAVAGTMSYRRIDAGRASAALAEAMSVAEAPVVPPSAPTAGKAPVQQPGTFPTDRARVEAALPKWLAVADAYPASDSGIIARYRAAAALVALGRTPEGIQRYREVVEKGRGAYQVMARLGVAEAQLASGQYDLAIASFKEVAALNSEDAPADGVLMQLARAYRLSGKEDEARKTFKRVADEHPLSPYASSARRDADAETAASAGR